MKRFGKVFRESYRVQFAYYFIAILIINSLMNVAGIYEPSHNLIRIIVQSLIFAVIMTGTNYAFNVYKNKKG